MANLTAKQCEILREMLKIMESWESLNEARAERVANPHAQPHESSPSSPFIPTTPPIAPQPPDPLDFNQFGQRLSKFEFPKFDGTLLREWFRRCDEYFDLHKTPPEMRVRVASPHMIGKALQWHTNYIRNNFGIFPSWIDYIIAISAKFGDDDALPMHRAPFNPYSYNPYTTPLFPPTETIEAPLSKPVFTPKPYDEIQARRTKEELCLFDEEPYIRDHQLKRGQSHIFVKECEDASMSGDEANRKTNSVLDKETIPSNALCQRVPATQSQNNNMTQEEELIHDTKIIMEIGLIQEYESLGLTDSILDAEGVHPQESLSQFEVLFSSLEPSRRCHCHYESLDVIDEDMCKELVMNEDEQPLKCVDEESSRDEKSSEEAVTILEAHPHLLNTFLGICVSNKVDNSWVRNDRRRGMTCFLLEVSIVELVESKVYKKELLVTCLRHLNFVGMKLHLKHKWRSKISQPVSELKQRLIVSVWKSLGYLMEAYDSQYEGLLCAVEKRKIKNVEDGVKQVKNSFFGDVMVKIIMALEELCLMHSEEKRDAHTSLLVKVVLVVCSSAERTTMLRIILRGVLLHDKEEDVIASMKIGEQQKDIETACVLLRMSLNGDTHTFSYLIKDYGDGIGILWLKLPLNYVQNDVIQIVAAWDAKHRRTKEDGIEKAASFDRFDGLNASVIAAAIMQSSKSLDQLRVAGLHDTPLGFLYGSLPRPPEENFSDFSNIVKHREDCWFAFGLESVTWSYIFCRIWTRFLQTFCHQRSRLSSLRTRMFSTGEYCYRNNDDQHSGLISFLGPSYFKFGYFKFGLV